MSVGYRAVSWNRNKQRYDLVLLAGALLYLGVFLGVGAALHPQATAETLILRATGSGAIILLHLILTLGPLCRFQPRWLPLLYNRRHLGVAMFCLAALHGAFALFQYHALGDVNPLVSLLTAESAWDSLQRLPFQIFGAAALLILSLMAATSHDFWLANLGAPLWKALHMLVYVAWLLLVLHVGFGVLQDEVGWTRAALLGLGVLWVGGWHLAAGLRERRGDRSGTERAAAGAGGAGAQRPTPAAAEVDWVDTGLASEIPEDRARVVLLSGERVAIFRWQGRVAALSNVCRHQGGPLGEGRIVDGCVTCPWHGYQYRPEDGCSPPPFTERVATYRVRLVEGRVQVDPRPAPAGTPQEPARCASEQTRAKGVEPFYIGYLPAAASVARALRRSSLLLLLVVSLLAAGLAAALGPFQPADFEFGIVRDFEGQLAEQPTPSLRVRRPGLVAGHAVPLVSRYLLVAPGKHGAESLVAGLDGQTVRLRGSLVHRQGQVMLELADAPMVLPASAETSALELSAAAAGAPAEPPPAALVLGEIEVVGEIVDSKCHFGVMVPADTRTHRACAVRCLSGGLPVLLLVRLSEGGEAGLLLVGRDGRALNAEILDRVAEPLRVRGLLEQHDDLLVLKAEPSEFVRLLDSGRP
ncbi:MAG: Rieske 2Fe-2S domain-containing protein [Planctomycetota bacterium]